MDVPRVASMFSPSTSRYVVRARPSRLSMHRLYGSVGAQLRLP
jgi:hypothetical protein